MYATNAEKYNYKTTLDDDLSEYTTVLVREDTEEDRLRWERACRLVDEMQKRRCPTDGGGRAAKLDNIKTNRNQYSQRRRGRYQNYSKQLKVHWKNIKTHACAPIRPCMRDTHQTPIIFPRTAV